MNTQEVISEEKDYGQSVQKAALKSNKTLQDALLLASRNQEFGEHLLRYPEQIQEEYGLTDDQVAQIKGFREALTVPSDSSPLKVMNYESHC